MRVLHFYLLLLDLTIASVLATTCTLLCKWKVFRSCFAIYFAVVKKIILLTQMWSIFLSIFRMCFTIISALSQLNCMASV
jgi:hypothetical protein